MQHLNGILFVIFGLIIHFVLSDVEIEKCPKDCFCELQHWKELSVMQFLQYEQENVDTAHYLYTNDATQFEDISMDQNPLIKVVICVIQSNTTLKEFLLDLPPDVEALTLIQGSSDEHSQLFSSDLIHLQFLKILEIKGSETFVHQLKYIIDTPIKDLSYLNFENIHLERGDNDIETIQKKFDEVLQKLQFVSILNDTEEIVPYEVYKEQQRRKKLPLFKGHDNLILLRISGCNLSEIIWEMFDQLLKLRYMYLDNNGLKIIPAFAFFGVPKLEILSLSKNHLLDVNASDLSGLLDLEYLDLSYNNFSQLSELTFPPFPKLRLADFRNNPISTIYPNTFEIMNTTKSIILGNRDTTIRVVSNAFVGLAQLETLKVYNLNISILNRDILEGMKNLNELVLTGYIKQIEFDTFIEMKSLEKLILKRCSLSELSLDSFIGLKNLKILDLSLNELHTLALGIFDPLTSIQEILLNDNHFTDLPSGIFYKIPVKLIRLNNNPWDCTCNLMHWNSQIVNRIKYKIPKICRHDYDKGIDCQENDLQTRYIYDRRVAPLCSTPKSFINKGVFYFVKKLRCHQMQKKLKMTKKVMDYIKTSDVQAHNITTNVSISAVPVSVPIIASVQTKMKLMKMKKMHKKHRKIHKHLPGWNEDNNTLNNSI